MLFNFYISVCYANFFLWLISNFILLWSVNIFCIISFKIEWGLFYGLASGLCCRMFYVHLRMHALTLLSGSVLYMSVKSTWYTVLFTSSVSLLIFFLDDTSTILSVILKSPTVITYVSLFLPSILDMLASYILCFDN